MEQNVYVASNKEIAKAGSSSSSSDIFTNTPITNSAPNTNPLTMAVFLCGFLCFVFFVGNRRELRRDYQQSITQGDVVKPVVAGQLGLRYVTQFTTNNASYNEASEPEKQQREQAVVEFLREAQNQQLVLPYKFVVTIADKANSDVPVQAGVQNVECPTGSVPTNWWRARYDMLNLLPEDPAGLNNLPIAYMLQGTTADGKQVVHYGPVKSLHVEISQDVLSNASATTGVSYKLYFTLVDTNWQNAGGQAGGKNSLIDVIASQQSDRCAFSTIMRNNVPYNVFISAFTFCLMPRLVPTSEDVRLIFSANAVKRASTPDSTPASDVALASGLSEVRFHATKDKQLHFVLRSLPLVVRDLKWTIARSLSDISTDYILRMHCEDITKALPLQLHIRNATEALGLKGGTEKYLAFPVFEVLARYNAPPMEPGDLREDTVYIRGVQFTLPGDLIVAQDATDKSLWYANGVLMHKDTTIDLLVLSEKQLRSSAVTEVALPKVDGENDFVPFKVPAFGSASVSLGKEIYDGGVLFRPETADLRVLDERIDRMHAELLKSYKAEASNRAANMAFGMFVLMLSVYVVSTFVISKQSVALFAKVVAALCLGAAFLVAGAGVMLLKEWQADFMANYGTRMLGILTSTVRTLSLICGMLTLAFTGVNIASCVLAPATAALTFMLNATRPKEGAVGTPEWEKSIGPLRVTVYMVIAMSLWIMGSNLKATTTRVQHLYEVEQMQNAMHGGKAPKRKLTYLGLPSATIVVSTFTVLTLLAFLVQVVVNKAPDACVDLRYQVRDLDGKIKAAQPQNGTTASEEAQALINFYTLKRDSTNAQLTVCQKHAFGPAMNWWAPPVLISLSLVGIVLAREAAIHVVRKVRPTHFAPRVMGGVVAMGSAAAVGSTVGATVTTSMFTALGFAAAALVGFTLSMLNAALPESAFTTVRCNTLRKSLEKAEDLAVNSVVGREVQGAERVEDIEREMELVGCRSQRTMSLNGVGFVSAIALGTSMMAAPASAAGASLFGALLYMGYSTGISYGVTWASVMAPVYWSRPIGV